MHHSNEEGLHFLHKGDPTEVRFSLVFPKGIGKNSLVYDAHFHLLSLDEYGYSYWSFFVVFTWTESAVQLHAKFRTKNVNTNLWEIRLYFDIPI